MLFFAEKSENKEDYEYADVGVLEFLIASLGGVKGQYHICIDDASYRRTHYRPITLSNSL